MPASCIGLIDATFSSPQRLHGSSFDKSSETVFALFRDIWRGICDEPELHAVLMLVAVCGSVDLDSSSGGVDDDLELDAAVGSIATPVVCSLLDSASGALNVNLRVERRR